jgi:hypothetical protein
MSKIVECNYEVSILKSTLIMKKSNTRLGKNKPLLQSVKGKPIPLQVWPGHEGSRRFRLPDIETIST